MVLMFGKATCEACIKKKEELQKEGTAFKYYDLDTAEGMAKAASLDLLSENKDLPIIIDSSRAYYRYKDK